MKYRLFILAVLATLVYSCSSKSKVPTVAAEVKPGSEFKVYKSATVMTPELAEGKELYDNNCAKCHSLYNPKEFSAEEWTPIVARMQKKAHLDDMQGQKIYNYLTMK